MAADVDSLGLCPGIGPLKARRLHTAFNTSFIKQTKSATKRQAEKHDCDESQTRMNDIAELRDDDIQWSDEENS